MDFFDNVVKSSNALIKDRLNNPFGTKQQTRQQSEQSQADSLTTDESNKDSEALLSSQQTTMGSSSNEQPAQSTGPDQSNSQFAAIAADAEAVTQKAVAGAKNIGNFLFSMANKAGQTVSQTAKQVKQVVENTTILTDFTREQQDFIREHGGSLQSGELPWANCQDEAKATEMREQILSLSQDKRNFVRSPPNDADFQYDPQQCYPIALTLLKEDPNLSRMRYELVPKLVSEDAFWCNYFYRVSLLKQFIDKGAEQGAKQGWASSRSSSGEGPDEITATEADELVHSTNAPSADIMTSPQGRQPPASRFNLDSSRPETSTTTDIQDFQSEESKKLFAEADDLKSKLKELNIGSFDDGGQDG